jgi:beta-lactamase regulating signal transducer with metallopeptidase domain
LAWVATPLVLRLSRVPSAPGAWCRAARSALFGVALLPLLTALRGELPARVRPRLPATLQIEAWLAPAEPRFGPPPVAQSLTIGELSEWFGAAWLLLLAYGVTRELVRHRRARALWAQATTAPPHIAAACARLAEEYGVAKTEVRVSQKLAHAGTLGLFSPKILCAVEDCELTEEALELLLRHELIHVRRRDSAWHTLERVAATTLLGHPSLAPLRCELSLSREAAVDREVAAGRLAAYAELLLAMAERRSSPHPLAFVSIADTSIERRIHMLIDTPIRSGSSLRALTIVLALLGAALFAPAAFAERSPPRHHFTRPLPPPEELEPKVRTDVDACYAEASKQDPDLVIHTQARLELDRSGAVKEAHIPSESSVFQACIEGLALDWHFRGPPEGAPEPPPDAHLMVAFPIDRSPR